MGLKSHTIAGGNCSRYLPAFFRTPYHPPPHCLWAHPRVTLLNGQLTSGKAGNRFLRDTSVSTEITQGGPRYRRVSVTRWEAPALREMKGKVPFFVPSTNWLSEETRGKKKRCNCSCLHEMVPEVLGRQQRRAQTPDQAQGQHFHRSSAGQNTTVLQGTANCKRQTQPLTSSQI